MPGLNPNAEYSFADLGRSPAAWVLEMPTETGVGVCCSIPYKAGPRLVKFVEVLTFELKRTDPGAGRQPNGCELSSPARIAQSPQRAPRDRDQMCRSLTLRPRR